MTIYIYIYMKTGCQTHFVIGGSKYESEKEVDAESAFTKWMDMQQTIKQKH